MADRERARLDVCVDAREGEAPLLEKIELLAELDDSRIEENLNGATGDEQTRGQSAGAPLKGDPPAAVHQTW